MSENPIVCQDSNMLMIGSVIFAMAIEGVHLHKRIALKVMLAVGPRSERSQ